MPMYLAENLKYLRKKLKLSQEKMGKQFDVTRSAYSSYEDKRAEPRIETLKKMSEIFNISIDLLLDEKLEVLDDSELKRKQDSEKYATGENLRILTVGEDVEKNENVLFVPEKASAGYSKGYADPEYMGTLKKYSMPFLPTGKSYRAFEIEGDSMLPLKPKTIVVGSYVENWTDIKNGEKYIVVSEQNGCVFKMVDNNILESSELLLKSLNTQYSSYSIPVNEVKEVWKFEAYVSREFPEESNAYASQDWKDAFWRLEDDIIKLKKQMNQKPWIGDD